MQCVFCNKCGEQLKILESRVLILNGNPVRCRIKVCPECKSKMKTVEIPLSDEDFRKAMRETK